MLVFPLLAILIRYFFRSSLLPSRLSSIIHALTFIPVFVLYSHLTSIGSPRRDSATGALIGSGEDLNMPGITEWCWDIIYITWFCQVGSAIAGEWVWWIYLSVRKLAILYSVYLCRFLFFACLAALISPTDTAIRILENLLGIPQTLFLFRITREHRRRRPKCAKCKQTSAKTKETR